MTPCWSMPSSASQAEQLVQRLQPVASTDQHLHQPCGDPDYYFGLDTLTQAFPV
jgi:hypothetical protein